MNLLRVVRAAARIVVGVAFAAAVLLVGAIWVLPRTTSIDALTVLTGSMDPAIPQGSIVFVRPVDPRALEIGDVITFHPDESTAAVVTHRVTNIARNVDNEIVLRTKGDNNPGEDPWPVLGDAVVGKVLWDVPLVGRLSQRASTPGGSALVLGVPLVILVATCLHTLVSELWRWRGERRSTSAEHAREGKTAFVQGAPLPAFDEQGTTSMATGDPNPTCLETNDSVGALSVAASVASSSGPRARPRTALSRRWIGS